MFSKTGEYIPQLPLKYTDKITSITSVNNTLWIGREDGVIEMVEDTSFYKSSGEFLNGKNHQSTEDVNYLVPLGQIHAFESEFDYLENEDIKERVNAMAIMTDGGINEILFTGNEKNLKVFKIRKNDSTANICNDKDRVNGDIKGKDESQNDSTANICNGKDRVNGDIKGKDESQNESYNFERVHKNAISPVNTTNTIRPRGQEVTSCTISNGTLCQLNYRITNTAHCSNIHSYVLNSISLNASNDFMITSDYIKINLWRPSKLEDTFTLVDIKQQIAGGYIYVINAAKFSSQNDSLFGYSCSNGEVYLNDISISPKSRSVLNFKNLYSQSIKSISDFVFVDSNFILTRSMNNLCLFDQRNPKREVLLKELVVSSEEQNILNSGDAVYDKFKIDCSGHRAYTGSYFGSVYCYDLITNEIEEILLCEKRSFSHDRKIKNVVALDRGFSCVANGRIRSYTW